MKPLIACIGLFFMIAIIKPPTLQAKYFKKKILELKNTQRVVGCAFYPKLNKRMEPHPPE